MKYEQHPIGAFYPPLTTEEIQKLRAQVRTNHHTMSPAILYEGKILDGWHYYNACLEEEIEPKLAEPRINDPREFVVRRHEGRRHLTTGQRAVIAEGMATWESGSNQYANKEGQRIRGPSAEKAVKDAAQLNKVGTTSVTEVRRAKEQGIPEIYQAIKDGKLKPYRANEIARLPKDQQAAALQAELNGNHSIGNRKHGQTQPKSGSNGKKETRSQRAERLHQLIRAGKKPGETLGLTREQVDPDFKGTSMEWMDTYGHVQIMTKEQLEADRKAAAFLAWVGSLRDLKVALQKHLETTAPQPKDLQVWIGKSNLPERQAKRLAEVQEWVSLIVRARESIDWIEKALEIFIKI